MNVRVSARARREADRRDAWWRENRPEAADALRDELLAALDLLRQNPDAGQVYEAVRVEVPVRRLLLPRTETHLYHARVDQDVVVLAVWGARRGRGPKL